MLWMKRVFITILIFAICGKIKSQTAIERYHDSVKSAKSDSDKAKHLYFLSYYYQYYKPDSALFHAQSSYELSKKIHFEKGQRNSLGQMALAFNRLGDFSEALKYYLEQLELMEKQNDPYNVGSAYLSIALVYNSQKDVTNALYYAYKADSIASMPAIIESDPALRLYTLLDLGEIFSGAGKLDSAIHYTRWCYHESIRLDTIVAGGTKSISGTALNNMGNIYFKGANFNDALMYYENSIPYLELIQDYNTLSECYYGIAQCFQQKNQTDSALHYAYRSYNLSNGNKFLKHAVNASYLISKIYWGKNAWDSAYNFQQTYITLKDSLDNTEKIRQLQSLTINEELRQKKIAFDLAQQAKERRIKLELLFVGMFIPVLFLISAFIAGRRVNRRLIRVLGIFSVLFLFEYITLLLHPWVMEKTNHSPMYEILIFVAIASVISPTHHRIESWLVSRLHSRHQSWLTRRLELKAAAEAAAKAKEEAAARLSENAAAPDPNISKA
jgi:tetratricopeptide (TPR) repeat protein